jgi:hypothetical protein
MLRAGRMSRPGPPEGPAAARVRDHEEKRTMDEQRFDVVAKTMAVGSRGTNPWGGQVAGFAAAARREP